MAGVVRGIVVLFAVFAVINAETFKENVSSDENTLNSLENAGDLAENLAAENNEDEKFALQEDSKGRRLRTIVLTKSSSGGSLYIAASET